MFRSSYIRKLIISKEEIAYHQRNKSKNKAKKKRKKEKKPTKAKSPEVVPKLGYKF